MFVRDKLIGQLAGSLSTCWILLLIETLEVI